MIPKKPSELLHEAAAQLIPRGQVQAMATALGIAPRTLTYMRKRPVDVGIDSFAQICQGLGLPPEALLGLAAPGGPSANAAAARAAAAEIHQLRRQLSQIRKHLVRVRAEIERLLEPLPED